VWSCEAAGGNWRDALPAAAAIELLHNFSLLHDDIEDNSAERRGRATVWKEWGVAQAINGGDAMFALARLALDRLGENVSPATAREVYRLFDRAALALTQGQYLDLRFERADGVTLEDYLVMVRGKSAALVAASAEIGALLGSDSSRLVNCFRQYGENLGIAFQIADDILGNWGDPAVTGKPAGADILSKKKSFPIIAALQTNARGELLDIFKKEKLTTKDAQAVAELLTRIGARGSAEEEAESHLQRALNALNESGLENKAMQRLRAFAQRVVYREK
jgi:geranylgeranyl diphosphate synthase type I